MKSSFAKIRNPKAMRNQPNPFFKELEETFLASEFPKNIPPMAMAENGNKINQLGENRVKSPTNPKVDLTEMINNDVAMAFFISNLPKRWSNGMIRKPPPAPTVPVKRPSIKPAMTKE